MLGSHASMAIVSTASVDAGPLPRQLSPTVASPKAFPHLVLRLSARRTFPALSGFARLQLPLSLPLYFAAPLVISGVQGTVAFPSLSLYVSTCLQRPRRRQECGVPSELPLTVRNEWCRQMFVLVLTPMILQEVELE